MVESCYSRERYLHLSGFRWDLRIGGHSDLPWASTTDRSRYMRPDKVTFMVLCLMLLVGVPSISAAIILGLARYGALSMAWRCNSVLGVLTAAPSALRNPSEVRR